MEDVTLNMNEGGRGRGTRHGAVSIKVERVVRNQEQEDNGGAYEDEVVYVTERPRRRGRPRKPMTVPPRPLPKPLPQRHPRSNEVIYVSAARGRPQYVIPSRAPVQHSLVSQPLPRSPLQHSLGTQPPSRTPVPSRTAVQHSLVTAPPRTSSLVQPRPLSMCAAICPRPVRCVVTGVPSAGQTIVNVTKPVLTLGLQRVTETKINWPSDLQELVASWDNLPERRTRDVVKWFQTVSGKSQPPKIVCEIHEMWAAMPETWEEKVDLALEWLREDSHAPSRSMQEANVNGKLNGVKRDSVPAEAKCLALPQENRAKVLVEAQPNPMQVCGQWSSMAENREDSKN